MLVVLNENRWDWKNTINSYQGISLFLDPIVVGEKKKERKKNAIFKDHQMSYEDQKIYWPKCVKNKKQNEDNNAKTKYLIDYINVVILHEYC